MSCNIEYIIELHNTLTIASADVEALLTHYEETEKYLPDDCFLNDLDKSGPESEVLRLAWFGEGSGHSWEWFKADVIPKLKGEFKGLVIWEGGGIDSIMPLWIRDGKLIPCELEYVLKEKLGT